MAHLDLVEWQTAGADQHPVLVGRTLDDPAVMRTASRLRHALRIADGRNGLLIEVNQHVGVLQLGDLRVRIRPKIPTETLWGLVAYGLGLDELPRHPPTDFALDGSLPDLLAAMLVLEATRLWRDGLQRGYVTREEWLASPRGRPDLVALARNGPLTRAELPCRHHEYTPDILVNQLVLGGLTLASRLPGAGPRLRATVGRAVQEWRTVCSDVPATVERLDAAERASNPLTARYTGAHRLARALLDRAGPDDDLGHGIQPLGGALWNMARVFERAVARFLREQLPSGWSVDTQTVLKGLYTGAEGRRPPSPTPDLVVRRGGLPVAVMDTKYKDLSQDPLPRDILYQLTAYSLAFGPEVPAVVLYAIPTGDRPPVRIRLNVVGAGERVIVLRAVPLDILRPRAREQERALGWLER